MYLSPDSPAPDVDVSLLSTQVAVSIKLVDETRGGTPAVSPRLPPLFPTLPQEREFAET